MIRPYTSKDKGKLLQILRLNTPAYFHPSEEQEYLYFLDHHREHYFVVANGGNILGAGGFNYAEGGKIARISWDLFHPAVQGKGWGSKLLQYRIATVAENPAVEIISVRTTQLVFRFYEKFGFALQETVKDFWAPGFDLYWLELKLKET
ncbi:MAG: family acetyltransferase [Adhaeribacter sp.]|nr:family acetyltransferase [Adhaeribacter sp.]